MSIKIQNRENNDINETVKEKNSMIDSTDKNCNLCYTSCGDFVFQLCIVYIPINLYSDYV